MLEAWKRLEVGIKQVRDDLALVASIDALLRQVPGSPEVEAIRAYTTPAEWHPRFYSAAIVGLYGVVERFVTDAVGGAVRSLSSFAPIYSDLPEVLRRFHLDLSLREAVQVFEGRGRSGATLESIIANVQGCLQDHADYEVNHGVVALSGANFRAGVIVDVLRRTGIEMSVAELGAGTQCTAALGGVLNGLYADAASVLDDLADRRNEVAHGRPESELLDLATLSGVTDVIEGVARQILGIGASFVVSHCVEWGCRSVGVVEHTWAHPATQIRSIAKVVPAAGVTLACADDVIVLADRPRIMTVESLQSQQVNVDPVTGDGNTSYGVALTGVVRKGERIFIPGDTGASLFALLREAQVIAAL